MRYIIAEPDEAASLRLRKILDSYGYLDHQGSCTDMDSALSCCRDVLPHVAFIRMGTEHLNAFGLADEVHRLNPFAKVVYLSELDALSEEAFDHSAAGFILVPFNEYQIEHSLTNMLARR
jgi:DNA-binding LytR/AlgR family response regulator